jgi:hypothetical protein
MSDLLRVGRETVKPQQHDQSGKPGILSNLIA